MRKVASQAGRKRHACASWSLPPGCRCTQKSARPIDQFPNRWKASIRLSSVRLCTCGDLVRQNQFAKTASFSFEVKDETLPLWKGEGFLSDFDSDSDSDSGLSNLLSDSLSEAARRACFLPAVQFLIFVFPLPCGGCKGARPALRRKAPSTPGSLLPFPGASASS